ncbi:unnamed protein product [Linum trigynum]|uniref:Uncharacterized protein n=1 Tax=Linum trigynum TaxID=586398 RepID=A0AAV2GV68_9ROSI
MDGLTVRPLNSTASDEGQQERAKPEAKPETKAGNHCLEFLSNEGKRRMNGTKPTLNFAVKQFRIPTVKLISEKHVYNKNKLEKFFEQNFFSA